MEGRHRKGTSLPSSLAFHPVPLFWSEQPQASDPQTCLHCGEVWISQWMEFFLCCVSQSALKSLNLHIDILVLKFHTSDFMVLQLIGAVKLRAESEPWPLWLSCLEHHPEDQRLWV